MEESRGRTFVIVIRLSMQLHRKDIFNRQCLCILVDFHTLIFSFAQLQFFPLALKSKVNARGNTIFYPSVYEYCTARKDARGDAVDQGSYSQPWEHVSRVILAYDIDIVGGDRSCVVLLESIVAAIMSLRQEIEALPGIYICRPARAACSKQSIMRAVDDEADLAGGEME
jgi:hypothetical protein